MKYALAQAVGLFVCGLVFTACGGHGPGTAAREETAAESKETGVPVRTTVIKVASIPDVVSGYGSVSGGPNSRASLAFPEGGRIATVSATVGEHVRAGQVLAMLDARGFAADAAQAGANVAVARANLQKVLLGSRPQQLAQTDAQIQQAQTAYAVARAQLERQQKLFSLGIASQADVDAASAAAASAKSALRILQEQRQTQTHPWQPDVEAAKAELVQAQAAASATQQKVSFATLTAPFDGVVVARLHNDGETVDSTNPIIELANESRPIFTAQFAPRDANKVHAGDHAIVSAQGTTDVSKGQVVAINPLQGDDKTVSILIRLDTASSSFGPGTYGKSSVVVGSRSGLVVPSSAIVSDPASGSTQIFRRDHGHYTPVPVSIAASTNDRAIVQGQGLRPGDTVVVQGAYELLNPGQSPKADND